MLLQMRMRAVDVGRVRARASQRRGKPMNQRKAGAVLSYVYLGITFAIGVIYTPILFDFLGEREYGVY